jgi:predicted RNA binding protein YcfA (HicA-like mRNA interferase family)
MPSLSELPGNINRNKFIKALERLGFEISTKGGKGSHYKATFIRTQKSITIQSTVSKNVLYYLLKEIEIISSVTWTDIKKYL